MADKPDTTEESAAKAYSEAAVAKIDATARKVAEPAAKPTPAAVPAKAELVKAAPVKVEPAKPVVAAEPAKAEPVAPAVVAAPKPVAPKPAVAKAPVAAKVPVAAKPVPAKPAAAAKKISKPVAKPAVKPATPAKAPVKSAVAKASAPKAKPAPVAVPATAEAPARATVLKEQIMTDFNSTVSGTVNELQTRAKVAYDKGTEAVGEATEFAKGNVEALVESGKIIAGGVQDLGKSYVEEAKSAYETLTVDLKEMAAVKSPTELFQLQSKIMRRNFDALVATSSKNSEALVKLAGDAFAPISGRVNLAAEKLTKSA